MVSSTLEKAEENPIEKMAISIYPPFALLAGMQLDLFSPLKDEPMSAEQIAAKIGVASAKLKPLLYALVVAGFLSVDSEYFSNTDAANRYLVKSSPSCVGDIHELLSTMWSAALKTAESIRTGSPQAKLDYSEMSQDDLRQFFRGEHPYAVEWGYGIIDNSHISPQKLVGFNLVYINVYDEGQGYTEQEHKDWLEDADFGNFRRTILDDGSSIITARKIK
jgi:hypothetical protein